MDNEGSINNEVSLDEKIEDFQAKYDLLKQSSLDMSVKDWFYIERKSVQQSRLFMIDIIPHIYRLYYDWPTDNLLNVLDVGVHCGAGTALLAELHNKRSHNYLKMYVTGLDIIDDFEKYIKLCYPFVNFINKDIFDIPDSEKWDLVICSHVIEHLQDPFSFIEKLRRLTTKYLIVACPYNETDLRPGHSQTISDDVIKKLNPLDHHVYTNFCWRTRGQCLIMIFDSLK